VYNYPKETYDLVLSMNSQNIPMTVISRETGVAYRTVQAWVYGETKPRSMRTQEEWDEINKKIFTPETRKKMSDAKRGKKRSVQARRNISLSKMGEKNPMWKGENASDAAGRARARTMYGHLCPEGKEIHHIDDNPRNNAPDNVEFKTRKGHMERDGRMNNRNEEGRFK